MLTVNQCKPTVFAVYCVGVELMCVYLLLCRAQYSADCEPVLTNCVAVYCVDVELMCVYLMLCRAQYSADCVA